MTYVYLAAIVSAFAAFCCVAWVSCQIAAEYTYEMESNNELESNADDGTVGDGERTRDG